MTTRMHYRAFKTALAIIAVAILSSGTLFAVQIKVACVQMRLRSNTQTNVNNTISYIQSEAAQGTEVLLFPECSLTDYKDSVLTGITQPTINNAIAQVAAACDANNVYAIVGSPYYEGGIRYNADTVIGPDGQIIHRYYKMHEVSQVMWDGNEVAMFSIKGVPATIFTCHDERYPELMRIPVYAGAKIGFYNSFESYDLSKEFNYRCQIVGRAVENQSWVVSCNAPMANDSGDSHGQSRIIGPNGTVYAEAGRTEAAIRYTIDTDQSSNTWAQAGATTPLLSEFWKEGLRVLQSQNLDYFGSVTASPTLLPNTGVIGNSPNANVKIACVQMRMTSNISTNVTNAISYIASEAAQGTRVVMLPECALTDRNPTVLASVNQSQIDAAIAQIANACDTNNVYAIVGSPFRDGGQLYNGAYVIDPNGAVIKRYAQLHTDLPGVFTDGSKMSLFKIDGMYATVIVGHDIHFPELSRIANLAGAKVVFCLAYEAAGTTLYASESQVVCRAVESQCYTVFCNAGTGNDAGNSTGHSRIVSPYAEIYAEAGSGSNTAVRATIMGSEAANDYAVRAYHTPSIQVYWQEGLDIIRRNNPEFYGDPTVDTTSPGSVTGFTAAPRDAQIKLVWTNPSDSDLTGTMIRFKTTGYPTSATDGASVTSKTGSPGATDNFTHTGLINGVTYYYSAFAYDAHANYSTKADANAAPLAGASITLTSRQAGTITIDGSTSDWNLSEFVSKVRAGVELSGDYAIIGYDGGLLCYAGYWDQASLPTNAADHTAKVYCRHDATYQYLLVRCDDDQVNFANPASANWANDCIELYIDPSHNHGATALAHPGTSTSDLQLVIDAYSPTLGLPSTPRINVYCVADAYKTMVLAGVTASILRDSTGWWLEARILKSALNPDIPATGTFGFDFAFRDNDNPDATNYAGTPAQSTMYAWCDANGPGFPSKIPDHWGNLSMPPPPDVTPPGPVTNMKAYRGNGQVSLTWANPVAGDFAGTKVLAKTTDFPTSQTDGTVVYNGTATTCVNTSLTNGTKYYYAAFAYDASSNYSSAMTVMATPANSVDTTIPLAKKMDDLQECALRGNVVTATSTGYFYIQDPVNPWGIRVSSTDFVTIGRKVDVAGCMVGTGAERRIDCTGNTVNIADPNVFSVSPVALGNAAIGGVGFDDHAPGMVSGAGAYNVGLLVNVFGKVTQRQTTTPKYFYVDDGRGLSDGTTTGEVANVGVKIIADPASYAQGSYVKVNGVVSCWNSGGMRPQILPVGVQTLLP